MKNDKRDAPDVLQGWQPPKQEPPIDPASVVRPQGSIRTKSGRVTFEEVVSLRERLAAAEQRAATTAAALATLLGHLPSDEVLSESWQGDMYWEDIFALAEIVPIYRAALTAPATQPDERAAAERAIEVAALRVLTAWDQEDEPDIVDAFEALRAALGDPDTSRRDGLASLDATDGAAKETT